MITHEPCKTRNDCYHARGGRKAVETGQFQAARNLGRDKQREAARIEGLRRAASGETALMRSKVDRNKQRESARLVGLRNVESGQIVRLGKEQGRKNVESGSLERARSFIDWDKTRAAVIESMQSRQHGLDTRPELIIKAKLDSAGIRYEHPFNLNDKFLCDFYLLDSNTIIEVDGCYWHGCEQCGHPGRSERTRTDPGRNAYILACGYQLVIIKEHQVKDWKVRT